MTTLYLAWQHPPTRRWFPVGRLVHHQSPEVFEFVYVQGAQEAENVAGFRPIPEFPSLSRRYRASELFPTFRNRVMNSNRIDRGTYLNHLGLHAGRCDELAELSVSGGGSHSDRFETFPAIEPDAQGKLRARLMLRGLRHTNPHAIEAIETLRAGDELRVAVELNNPATTPAILVYTQDYYMLGWLPRYIAEAICRSCEWSVSDAKAVVAQVNKKKHHSVTGCSWNSAAGCPPGSIRCETSRSSSPFPAQTAMRQISDTRFRMRGWSDGNADGFENARFR